MKKNVQWLVIFVFALLLLTGCKGSEQEMQKKNGESEDVSSKVEAFLKKETNQSSETTQLLTETDAVGNGGHAVNGIDDRDRSDRMG